MFNRLAYAACSGFSLTYNYQQTAAGTLLTSAVKVPAAFFPFACFCCRPFAALRPPRSSAFGQSLTYGCASGSVPTSASSLFRPTLRYGLDFLADTLRLDFLGIISLDYFLGPRKSRRKRLRNYFRQMMRRLPASRPAGRRADMEELASLVPTESKSRQ